MRAYKAEKAVEEWLIANDKVFFIPKQWALRTYHGRKGRYLVPAIPSVVFLYGTRTEISDIKLRLPVLQYYMNPALCPPQPMVVPDNQMDNFITVASKATENDSVKFIMPDEIISVRDTKIKILGGPFDGVIGTLKRVKGQRKRSLVVEIDGLGAVTAEVSPDLIEVLE